MVKKGLTRRYRGGSQKWAIVQYDDRELNDIDKGLMNRNAHYAAKWGYEYIVKKEGYEGVCPYWRKVFLVKDILSTEKYRGILWLDTDATVYKMDIELEPLVEEGKHFYKSADNTPENKRFCAGVWFVLNTLIGKEIMSKWSEQYNEKEWRRNFNGKWKTNGGWAAENYEQGAFIETIIPAYGDRLKHYDDAFLQALEPADNAFILHFYFTKDRRSDFLEKHPLPMTITLGGYTRLRKTQKRMRRKKRVSKPPGLKRL